MFVRYVVYRTGFHRGLPGRYAKILGGCSSRRCAKNSKLQFAAFQRQVCEVSHNIAANPWQVCEDQFNKCY
ncbi:hypothetical protein Hanom_Chr00s041475g01774541 [Helianthus anomalus]